MTKTNVGEVLDIDELKTKRFPYIVNEITLLTDIMVYMYVYSVLDEKMRKYSFLPSDTVKQILTHIISRHFQSVWGWSKSDNSWEWNERQYVLFLNS